MKFDCVKVSGKVDYVRSVDRMNGGHKAKVSIDGAVIPNLQVSNKLYEEIEVGESVTLYGLFKKGNDKEKNTGILYGLAKQNGEKSFATQYRYQVPLFLTVTAAIAFCLTFVAGWIASIFPVLFFFGENSDYMYTTTVFAVIESSLVAAFFLWRALVMFNATSDPEAWEATEAAALSSRFSKLHK